MSFLFFLSCARGLLGFVRMTEKTSLIRLHPSLNNVHRVRPLHIIPESMDRPIPFPNHLAIQQEACLHSFRLYSLYSLNRPTSLLQACPNRRQKTSSSSIELRHAPAENVRKKSSNQMLPDAETCCRRMSRTAETNVQQSMNAVAPSYRKSWSTRRLSTRSIPCQLWVKFIWMS